MSIDDEDYDYYESGDYDRDLEEARAEEEYALIEEEQEEVMTTIHDKAKVAVLINDAMMAIENARVHGDRADWMASGYSMALAHVNLEKALGELWNGSEEE